MLSSAVDLLLRPSGWFWADFGRLALQTFIFVAFGASLQKCKSKDAFCLGCGAQQSIKKLTFPANFLRVLMISTEQKHRSSNRFDVSALKQAARLDVPKCPRH